MGETSKIAWTDATWNIAIGCTKVDEDCRYCYMYRDGGRYGYDPMKIRQTKTVFRLPLLIEKPTKIFTCSLTDFFHEECDRFRIEAWDIIRQCPQHTFQILTKRPERIIPNLPEYWEEIRDRCWLGTSVGSQAAIGRIADLITPIQRGIKFLSLEPLYEKIDLDLNRPVDFGANVSDLIDWVIIGGESGNERGKYGYRPCSIDWIESIISSCMEYDIPVFVKQLGTHLSKEMGLKDRHGTDMSEWPEHLRIRQFPKSKEVL